MHFEIKSELRFSVEFCTFFLTRGNSRWIYWCCHCFTDRFYCCSVQSEVNTYDINTNRYKVKLHIYILFLQFCSDTNICNEINRSDPKMCVCLVTHRYVLEGEYKKLTLRVAVQVNIVNQKGHNCIYK